MKKNSYLFFFLTVIGLISSSGFFESQSVYAQAESDKIEVLEKEIEQLQRHIHSITNGDDSNIDGPYSVGDTVTFEDIMVTLDNVYITNKRNDFASVYNHVIVLEYTVTNNGTETYIVGDEFDVYANGYQADKYPMNLIEGPLNPGKTMKAVKAFGFSNDAMNYQFDLSKSFYHGEIKPIIYELDKVTDVRD